MPPIKSNQTPATQGMLNNMEERLNQKIDSKINEVKADIHEMKSELHRVALLVEEQNARNKYVLDGYSQIYDLIEKRKNL